MKIHVNKITIGGKEIDYETQLDSYDLQNGVATEIKEELLKKLLGVEAIDQDTTDHEPELPMPRRGRPPKR